MAPKVRPSSPWKAKVSATSMAIAILLGFAASSANAYYVVVDEAEGTPPAPATQGRGQPYPAANAGMSGLSTTRTNLIREDHYAVPFPKGVTPITGVSRAVLDRISARIGNNSDAKIRIVGRPDAMFVATSDPSLQVSRKRAVNLRGYFVRRGIPMSNITLEVDNDPNPTLDANQYPSYVYVTQSVAENQNGNVSTDIKSTQRTSATTPLPAPVQVPIAPSVTVGSALPIPSNAASNHDQVFALINSGVQSGQLSSTVALQLLRALLAEREVVGTPPALIEQPQPQPQQQRIVVVPLAPTPKLWILDKQITLRENIDNWSRLAGWNPTQWDATNYYQVTVTTTVKGDFPEVLRKVAESTGLNICAKPRQKIVRVTNSATPCQ